MKLVHSREKFAFPELVFTFSKMICIVNTYEVRRFFCVHDQVLAQKYMMI